MNTGVTLLITERTTQVGWALAGQNALILPIGHRQIAAAFFHHTPPTPLEIEHAIEAVEDAVMSVRAQLPAGATLASGDPALRALARHAGLREGERFWSLEAVEHLFNRLADRASGRPASQDDLPVDGDSAARLLIVREALHHWGLGGIALR